MNTNVVWVVGASSGIGKALAESFSDQGAKVILSARRGNLLEEISSALKTESKVLPFDIQEYKTAEEYVDLAVKCFGSLDYVVLCSGISNRSSVEDFDIGVLDKVMAVNFFGPAAIAKALVPVFKAQKSGNMVVISSIQGKIGLKNRAPYAASKHALHGFFDSLRLEVKNDGIKVLLVVLGYVKTEMSLNAVTTEADAKHSIMDKSTAQGFEPKYVAEKIIKAALNGSDEIVISQAKGHLALYLKAFLPSLLNSMLAKRD